MKRIISVLLILGMLLTGCAFDSPKRDNTITFYYLRSDYSYGSDSQVIVPEVREAPVSRNDLSYLMALYLMGPAEEENISPLPAGMRIIKTEEQGGNVTLNLSYPSALQPPVRFTLTCACLAMTCFALTDAETVTVTCSDQTLTLSRSSLTLYDDSAANQPTEETQ